MRRLLVAGAYLVGFWIAYPIAEVVAWTWTRWDHLQAHRHPGLRGAQNWYTG